MRRTSHSFPRVGKSGRSFSNPWKIAGAALAWACLAAVSAPASQTPQLTTLFRNPWSCPNPGALYSNYYVYGVGAPVYNGNTWTTYQVNASTHATNVVVYRSGTGGVMLAAASYGQPVESAVAQFQLGDVIPWPSSIVSTNVPPIGFVPVKVGNNTTAYYQSTNPVGAVLYIPSKCQVIAAAGGSVEIDWNTTSGVMRTVYTIASMPRERPARVFWTEQPYYAPAVQLVANGQQVFACIHYNNYITRPTMAVLTNQNAQGDPVIVTQLVSGVWIDGTGLNQIIRADGIEGMALLEYYADGSYSSSLDIQPIQVLRPSTLTLYADIGTRLLPNDLYYGITDLIPDIKAGSGSAVYQYGTEGPKYNWVFAIQRTVDNPWSVEIYWEQMDNRGVTWPFEVDHYSLDWPLYPQYYVLGDSLTNTAPILVPSALTATIAYQEPANNADLSSGRRAITANQKGYALLQYNTDDNIWFEVIQAVSHSDQTLFDLDPTDWNIGDEILPWADDNYAINFDGATEYVESTLDPEFDGTNAFTVEAWAYRVGRIPNTDGPVLSHTDTSGFTGSNEWELAYGWGSDVYMWTHAGSATWALPSETNAWHHLAGVYDGTNVMLYVDGQLRATQVATHPLGSGNHLLWMGRSVRNNSYFQGKIDEVRIWDVARSAEDISNNMSRTLTGTENHLVAYYPLDEGRGPTVYDLANGNYGTLYGSPNWQPTFHLGPTNLEDLAAYPGYLYLDSYVGTRFNVNQYHYPTEVAPDTMSHIFGVNTNLLEVWWARPTVLTDMPAMVYYPSLVLRYHTIWPTGASQIVMASGLGSGSDVLGAPTIYYQNNPALPGYNPNEEHALTLGGRVYALRDDLNRPDTSERFALAEYWNAAGDPQMKVYSVVRTNSTYPFSYPVVAGNAVVPPMPLGGMPPCSNTTSSRGPAWEDRKEAWWAKAAGNDGGQTNALMRFFYPMQASFYFPALSAAGQPPVGMEIPWLPTNSPPLQGGSAGNPLDINYTITWPDNVPELQIAQTLTMAANGLPDVWDQLSVEILYEQSVANGQGHSVSLFDPVVESGADLDQSVIDELVAASLARKDYSSSQYILSGLPPTLQERLYYDPNQGAAGQLRLKGLYNTTLTGGGYLLPNLLDDADRTEAIALGSSLDTTAKNQWLDAIAVLPTNITPIQPNSPYVNAALCTALSAQTGAVGYVTLVFNNSTDPQQVAPALPVSLSIIKVVPQLYNSYLDVIESSDALDEKLSLRYAADFGGRGIDYDFDWRYAEPSGGLPPDTNYDSWLSYGSGVVPGAIGVNIEGANPFTLRDNYFVVRYRRHDGSGPSGTNWSTWAYNLAPGWVQRVMNGINPYEQRYHDMTANNPNMLISMISQAGGPYEGDVALNPDNLDAYGLIQIYQTVLNRAKTLSIDAGISDSGDNDAVLFAASRLADLYMLLGNEAYSDAQDPTIGFGTDSTWFDHYGSEWSSLFCFMNQVPTLLDEELALLRGRDDTLQPSVQLSPIYNRLIWNYTRGINGGEVAYAMNYNIKGQTTNTTGLITADDAKLLYPQGHGDAWGHYLSALWGFYLLMSNTNFGWNTTPGATMVGNASVSSDFFDEQKFAEAAAAKARTGAEVVSREYREKYVEGSVVSPATYDDSNTNRQWGLNGWSSRAGQGAFVDWAVGNSLLLDTLTNVVEVGGSPGEPEGIQRIDRTTVPELAEIAAALQEVQTTMDNADLGMNPLGLDRNVVPFDISPAEIDEGKTHFEQIYERALVAMQNAAAAFDHAQGCTERLREQVESAYSLAAAAAESETDYHNRLIEIYGIPYPDDIGPGKNYPQGYDGPDLIDYQIVDLEDLFGTAPTGQPYQIQLYGYTFTTNSVKGHKYDYALTRGLADGASSQTVTVQIADNGLKVKPSTWTGRRPALGEIQMALWDFVKSWYSLRNKVAAFNNGMGGLQNDFNHLNATASRTASEWDMVDKNSDDKKTTSSIVEGLEVTKDVGTLIAEAGAEIADSLAKTIPGTITGAAGISSPVALVTVDPEKVMGYGITVIKWAKMIGTHATDWGIIGRKGLQERWDEDVDLTLKTNEYSYALLWGANDYAQALGAQLTLQSDVLSAIADFEQTHQKVVTAMNKGERLIADRAQARSRAAQRVQENRYADMTFRIFRDDALQKYNAAFELAARYVYLAAKAYDYETGLLDTDTSLSPGSQFLSEIARTRSLGRMSSDGTPMLASSQGDPGLADIMARMKADWDVVKGRMGFNNPDNETSRFSLRSELFRTSPSTSSDETWRNTLEQYTVDNLYDVPEFREYCIPFSSTTNREPGIVIPFSTRVQAGLNYFGNPLAGGDNAYDPTHCATKIRSVGVWFTGYNITFNTNTTSGGGLANEPRVYLIPVGEDVMRSPTRNSGVLRSWQVLDQAMPLPFNIGGADLDDPDYIPLFDSLPGSLAQARRYASLRAYHDRGQFDESETCNNARLVGRSVWNSRWLLIIPGRTLLSDPDEAIERFIYGQLVNGSRDGNGVKDIKIFFQTYSYWGE